MHISPPPTGAEQRPRGGGPLFPKGGDPGGGGPENNGPIQRRAAPGSLPGQPNEARPPPQAPPSAGQAASRGAPPSRPREQAPPATPYIYSRSQAPPIAPCEAARATLLLPTRDMEPPGLLLLGLLVLGLPRRADPAPAAAPAQELFPLPASALRALSSRGTLVLEAALKAALLSLEEALSEHGRRLQECKRCGSCLSGDCGDRSRPCTRKRSPSFLPSFLYFL
ncbi:serine protease 56-like [Crotalus adamanteus]|uniref:Serine protease 56-like n=1 Tax=Crotalus adamanteus TaxID=8729 RepID=A0AAW1BGW7_CROAD